jgi:hypothetical protein
MTATIREFLEQYPLYKKLSIEPGNGWRGDWPQVVDACCQVCAGEQELFRMWPRKLTSVTPDRMVYMLNGTCYSCGRDTLVLWVEVNQSEGWMQKAGQLPEPAPRQKTRVAAPRAKGSIPSN